MKNEILQNLTDPVWRRDNLYTIVDKEGNRIPFKENEIQKRIGAINAKRKMILKARQFGISTGEIVKMFDWTVFNKNATACILAHEQDSIKKLFRIVRRLYEFMPDPLKPELDRGGGSKYEMFFPHINSRIYCDLESRGDTIRWLHVSEAAFMKDSSKLKSTLQAVPMNGLVTIETTPNGMNHFYDMWNDHDTPYKKLFYPWYLFKEYKLPVTEKIILTEDEELLVKKAKKLFNVSITKEQIAFRRFKKSELKSSSSDVIRVSFEQEYPEDDQSCFLASGESAMDLFKVKQLIDFAKEPIHNKDGLKVFSRPNKFCRYVIGADPAEGIKKDFSVAVVIDVEAFEVVATLRGFYKPSDFAKKLNALGKMYSSTQKGWPTIAVERNNHGHAVLLELNEHLNYPELYVHPQDERLGWKTDGITRPLMVDRFIDAVEDNYLKVNDKDILNECLTLVDNNGKIEAAEGKHDDCVMATAIAFQVCTKQSTNIYDNLEERIRM